MRGPIASRRSRTIHLIQHCGSVHRFRRHGRHTDPGDTPRVPIHSDRQLRLDPAQRHGIQREHIQPSGIHQQVLTGPSRAQLPIGIAWTIGDIAVPLGTQSKRRVALLQLGKYPVCRCTRRQLHDTVAEPRHHPCVRPVDHHRLRRPRLIRVLDHHLKPGFNPPVIHSAERLLSAHLASSQAGFAVPTKIRDPLLDGAHAQAKFRCLRGVPASERKVRVVLRSRLVRRSHLCYTRSIASQCLSYVGGTFSEVFPLRLGHRR